MENETIMIPSVLSVKIEKIQVLIKKIINHVKNDDEIFTLTIDDELLLEPVIKMAKLIGYNEIGRKENALTFKVDKTEVAKSLDKLVDIWFDDKEKSEDKTWVRLTSSDKVFNDYATYIIDQINKATENIQTLGYPRNGLVYDDIPSNIARRLNMLLLKKGYEMRVTNRDYPHRISVRIDLKSDSVSVKKKTLLGRIKTIIRNL